MPSWSPAQYLKFADERTRAARDLLAQVPLKQAELVYDLGCGPGNSTALLVEAFPDAQVIGVDNSPEMLAKARSALPKVQFDAADLNSWKPRAGADLLYSNATYQWLPNNLAIFAQTLRGLKPGAVMAAQMPDNLAEPSHLAMSEAGLGAPYADKLREAFKARAVLPAPQDYYAALKPTCSRLDIWHTVYNHPLDGVDGIVEWLKATGLRPFLECLTNTEQGDYLARYQMLLAQHYPVQADGKVLLRFPRIFMVAVK